jgi:hypothetical protein
MEAKQKVRSEDPVLSMTKKDSQTVRSLESPLQMNHVFVHNLLNLQTLFQDSNPKLLLELLELDQK